MTVKGMDSINKAKQETIVKTIKSFNNKIFSKFLKRKD